MKQKTISLLLALALALSLAGCQKEETVTAPAGKNKKIIFPCVCVL